MIVDSALYRQGTRVAGESDFRALRACADQPGDFVWVGLHQPTEEEIAEVADVFGLHQLAVEDAVKAHQRPKLERYDDNLFLIVKTLWYVDEDDAVETGEIAMFVGHDFIVTVRHGQGAELHSSRAFLERTEGVMTHGPAAVVYAVCDRVVDGYIAVVDDLAVDVDEIESSVFSDERTNDAARIYTLKRELAEVRRAVMPLRTPMSRFATGDIRGFSREAAPFFRDVADHLARAAENVDALDSLLSTAFDAHLAQISVQQNSDMRKISAGAALIVVPTLIAGIYGMNYELSPSPDWAGGFWFAITLMAASMVGLYVWFKKAGWF